MISQPRNWESDICNLCGICQVSLQVSNRYRHCTMPEVAVVELNEISRWFILQISEWWSRNRCTKFQVQLLIHSRKLVSFHIEIAFITLRRTVILLLQSLWQTYIHTCTYMYSLTVPWHNTENSHEFRHQNSNPFVKPVPKPAAINQLRELQGLLSMP